jgi:1-acyl-sn-glycerol-3-phosphate acyltransferase
MDFPVPGDALPKRGNGFTAWLARKLLQGFGWRIRGKIPNVAKVVIIVAPHTSNWDFVVGVAAIFALPIKVKFLAKDTLFRWPLRTIMIWLGGVAVDRSKPHGVVGQVVEDFSRHGQFALAIAPQGTRRAGVRWHAGFYHIARGAGVPVLPVRFDHGMRLIEFGPALIPTGDIEAEIARLKAFCAVGRDRAPGKVS